MDHSVDKPVKTGLSPIAFDDATILILGTMPGEKSIENQEYYANRGNSFRKLLFGVFDENYSGSYLDFTRLLNRRRIALWNVIGSCRRNGSRDSTISDAVPNDIDTFLEKHPQIGMICFESKGAQVFYDRFFVRKSHIRYETLLSASGLYARIPFAGKLQQWKSVLLSGN